MHRDGGIARARGDDVIGVLTKMCLFLGAGRRAGVGGGKREGEI